MLLPTVSKVIPPYILPRPGIRKNCPIDFLPENDRVCLLPNKFENDKITLSVIQFIPRRGSQNGRLTEISNKLKQPYGSSECFNLSKTSLICGKTLSNYF